MSREERLAAALAAISPPCRQSIAPVHRLIIHDLNGVLSAVTMEAFAVEQLVSAVVQPGAGRLAEKRGRHLQNLEEAARSLRRAADGAASYLARLEALTDEPSPGK